MCTLLWNVNPLGGGFYTVFGTDSCVELGGTCACDVNQPPPADEFTVGQTFDFACTGLEAMPAPLEWSLREDNCNNFTECSCPFPSDVPTTEGELSKQSCTNSTTTTPLSPIDGPCCIGNTCVQLSEQECIDQGGIYQGAGLPCGMFTCDTPFICSQSSCSAQCSEATGGIWVLNVDGNGADNCASLGCNCPTIVTSLIGTSCQDDLDQFPDVNGFIQQGFCTL
jgi:hypothetical protein